MYFPAVLNSHTDRYWFNERRGKRLAHTQMHACWWGKREACDIFLADAVMSNITFLHGKLAEILSWAHVFIYGHGNPIMCTKIKLATWSSSKRDIVPSCELVNHPLTWPLSLRSWRRWHVTMTHWCRCVPGWVQAAMWFLRICRSASVPCVVRGWSTSIGASPTTGRWLDWATSSFSLNWIWYLYVIWDEICSLWFTVVWK